MKIILLNINCEGQISSKLSQQRTIDEEVLSNWPTVEMAKISNNGKYFGYVINIEAQNSRKLVIVDLKKSKILESTLKGDYQFSADSKIAIWINWNDSLCIATLSTNNVTYIAGVSLYYFDNKYISYLTSNQEFILEMVMKSNKISLIPISNRLILLADKGKNIYLQKGIQNDQKITIEYKKDGEKKEIWEGKNAKNFIIDKTKNQIAFIGGLQQDSIWYYRISSDTAVKLNVSASSNYFITGLSRFSENGTALYVELEKKSTQPIARDTNAVNIWNSLNKEQTLATITSPRARVKTGIIHLSSQRITLLDSDKDWLIFPKIIDTIVLIRRQEKSRSPGYTSLDSGYNNSWILFSLNNLRPICFPNDINENEIVEPSPYGKYIIYFDKKSKQYFVYETKSGHKRNLTSGIEEKWEKDILSKNYGRYISAWQTNDAAVFLNGERDIWQIDPSGKTPPLNLTNGYGKKNNIIFSLSLEEYNQRPLRMHEQLILSAFNVSTKENGFFKKKTGKHGEPYLLTTGAYLYNIPDNPSIPPNLSFPAIKALKKNIYIVRRMSSAEAPNYFITEDFRKFKQLSNLCPEKDVNWYTSELHNWSSLNDCPLQGILYKPLNFDSLRKYPVIFHIYERKSDGLNAYLVPRALENGCAINIPSYVSNGYLIFCPDINYSVGDPMQGTYDAIISAANYVAKLPYIDSCSMGLQGCSWGGIQTNYLIAHSNLFAAASSASSISNWISSYNSITKSVGNMQEIFESGQFRIGATLWEKPEIYIKNSSILFADKITTPLLLMHTIDDDLCNYTNALELFIALRKLGRKSWMLVYKGNHSIWGIDAIDYSLRMKQFFDHYLQKASPPTWMTDLKNKDK